MMKAEDRCLDRATWVDLLSLNLRESAPALQETTGWKVGCGKSARPVWKEGWRFGAIPPPIEYASTVNWMHRPSVALLFPD